MTQQDIAKLIKNHIDLEKHSSQCIHLLEKYIDKYHKQLANYAEKQNSTKLVCYIEVMDELQVKLSLMTLPDIAPFGRILDEEDDDFFKKTLFLTWQEQDAIRINTAKQLGIDDNDLYGSIEEPMEECLEDWLQNCWQQANQNKNTQHPLYYFYHDELDNALNLLNGKHYNLENL